MLDSILLEMKTNFNDILKKIDLIKPIQYSKNRNFIDGSVSKLSPYISRGVISTRYVYDKLMKKGYDFLKIEKFIQELCWRDYWQLIWNKNGTQINEDLKSKQKNVSNYSLPNSINNASTGILSIDNAINTLYETGYMHNHLRMYVASISCNIAQCHWKNPAKWMYYHLLDADWGSNALSWQWVSGSNSNRKYYANQDNINKYCYTKQKKTFSDVDYSKFESMEIPDILIKTVDLQLKTILPKNLNLNLNLNLPTLIYNFYNLDPLWRQNEKYNRIFLLEPSVFEKYPVSKKSIDFAIDISKNIDNIQLYVGSFAQLVEHYNLDKVIFKQHPLNRNYKGIEDQRDWMFFSDDIKSFFNYWKKCKKELAN